MNRLESALRKLAIGGIFLLPLVPAIKFTPAMTYPGVTARNFFFRIIVELITCAWFALALVEPRYRPRRNGILGAFLAFVLIVAIADVRGINPAKSFWSNFDRMDRLVTLIHLLLYGVVAVSVLDSGKLWRRLWQLSFSVSVLLASYGILQYAGIFKLGYAGAEGLSARIDSTLGNPMYLAAYMLFHLFIGVMLWMQDRQEQPGTSRRFVAIACSIGLSCDLAALALSGTRGTIVGLAVGSLVAGTTFAVIQPDSRRARKLVGVSLVLGALSVGGLWFARGSRVVQSVGVLKRMTSISMKDPTLKTRVLNMQIAWQGAKERPLLGWGQESYGAVFDRHYDPRMYDLEPWYDRAHCIVFDWLVASGFVGLISYLAILVLLVWTLAVRRDAFTTGERALMLGLVCGYFVHNLAAFDTIASYIPFVTLLACVAWREGEWKQRLPLLAGSRVAPEKLPILAALLAVVAAASAWWVNAGGIAQCLALARARAGISTAGEMSKKLELYREAISCRSFGTQEARIRLASEARGVAGSTAIPRELKAKFLELTASELESEEAATPMESRIPVAVALTLAAFGDYPDALVALERARQLSPRRPAILLEICKMQILMRKYPEALESSREAYDLQTSNVAARLGYAAAALFAWRDSLADELLADLIASGRAADLGILNACLARKDYPRIVRIWKPRMKSNPEDLQSQLVLAAACIQIGDDATALEALQPVSRFAPADRAEAERMIREIQR